ncbi:MAG: hypothetical protein WCK49_00385 [Myxococcaceae bacterium]
MRKINLVILGLSMMASSVSLATTDLSAGESLNSTGPTTGAFTVTASKVSPCTITASNFTITNSHTALDTYTGTQAVSVDCTGGASTLSSLYVRDADGSTGSLGFVLSNTTNRATGAVTLTPSVSLGGCTASSAFTDESTSLFSDSSVTGCTLNVGWSVVSTSMIDAEAAQYKLYATFN